MPATDYDAENRQFLNSVSSDVNGVVRHIPPEDIYDDRERMSYITTSTLCHPGRDKVFDREPRQNHREFQNTTRVDPRYQHQNQSIAPAEVRQISATSTITTAASGSENWETFDDASEPEVDVSDAYYAKLRAAKSIKRFTLDGGDTPPKAGPVWKKLRGMYGAG